MDREAAEDMICQGLRYSKSNFNHAFIRFSPVSLKATFSVRKTKCYCVIVTANKNISNAAPIFPYFIL